MALREGQVQIRDLVLGPGTPWRFAEEFNPFNRSVRADQSDSRAWNHGSWSGVEFTDKVVVQLALTSVTFDTSSLLARRAQVDLRHRLAAAFRAIGEDVKDIEMRFVMGGREYMMLVRPGMLEPELRLIRSGVVVTRAAFVALDPLIYDGAETVAGPIGLPSFTGGLTVPFTVPFTIEIQQVGGFANVTNEGTAETGLLLTIDGPVDQPSVTLVLDDGTAKTLLVNRDLLTGQRIDVDTAARTALLDNTTSIRGQVSGDFFLLPQGTHRLEFRGGSGSGALTARFRSAWW